MFKQKFQIGIPYFFLLGLIVYIALDTYNIEPYDPLVEASFFEPARDDHPVAIAVKAKLDDAQVPSAGMLLLSGSDSLSARLALIEGAKETIDMQYFLMKPDYAGAMISQALIEASLRGVRVRFLLDDVFTTTTNEQIRLLSSIENIEIRFFNPLSRKVPKWMNYGLDPMQINRRMHNKSMTVDGITAIIGGRNIADEYYDLSDEAIFADLDILLIGEVVEQIGGQFDVYWNDELATTVKNLLGQSSEEELKAAQAGYDARGREAIEAVYAEVVERDFLSQIGSSDHPVFPIQSGEAVYDQPAKLRHSVRERLHYPLLDGVKNMMENAQSQLVVLSPYFVPEDWGSEMFQDISKRGVEVIIATNSLEATNHAYVHGGYYYRRPELLRAGVRLFELRADALNALNDGEEELPKLTMHTKLFVVDQRYVYIGSMNFDPRSMYLNTEFGVILDSPSLAEELGRTHRIGLGQFAYELQLVDENENWIFNEDNPEEVYDSEPAGWFKRFVAWGAYVLPLELQY